MMSLMPKKAAKRLLEECHVGCVSDPYGYVCRGC
jgi:hypothetical protein